MDKDKKTFDVIDEGKPGGEAYEKESPTPFEMWAKSISPGTRVTMIPKWEMEKLANRCEQDPALDPAPEFEKLLFKYRKGIPKGSYCPPNEEGE